MVTDETNKKYRELACAIIHDGIRQYKKALREGYDLSVSRQYLNNHFYETLVKLVLDCTVDEMLDAIEENYEFTKDKKYNRGILYGKAEK